MTRVRRGPPPQLLAGCPERAQQATLPACARRCGSKSQGHREEEEGAARSRKRPWTVGESWLYGSRVRLRKASASSLHVQPFLVLVGGVPFSPSISFACSFCNTARHTGRRRAPCSGPRHPQQGERAAGGSPLLGSFLPALLWPGQERWTE